MSQQPIVSVTDLLARINSLFNENLKIGNIWIQGEVSGLTKHYTGHYYFTLKDAGGQIACAMWKTYASRLNFSLEEGMKVLVQGYVGVYERSGKMQLTVRAIKPDGIGALFLEFEQRKRALAQAGYFEASHKKPRPTYIEDIAVVTGKEAAALQDVLKTIQTRWPMARVHLYPALVQGPQAPQSIISALKEADQGHHDAILLVRGGGSFEDLFCFNDVDLIKAIYGLNTYIVSGVGHEIDNTLTDYVVEHRAVTPTAAAQWVTWDQNEIDAYLAQTKEFLMRRMNELIDRGWNSLAYIQNHPYLNNPQNYLNHLQQDLKARQNQLLAARTLFEQTGLVLSQKQKELETAAGMLLSFHKNFLKQVQSRLNYDILVTRYQQDAAVLEEERTLLEQNMTRQLLQAKESLEYQAALLKAASPAAIMEKGYAVIEQQDHVLTKAAQADLDQPLKILMQDGQMLVTIKERQENE